MKNIVNLRWDFLKIELTFKNNSHSIIILSRGENLYTNLKTRVCKAWNK
jgi:hypothetical protein